MDFLPTKGIEYLLAIGYLTLLTVSWFAVRRRLLGSKPVAAIARGVAETWNSWFSVPEGVYFHRGHTWAAPEGGDVFRVGLDDFARRLVGAPDAMSLPRMGDQLEQGEPGMRFTVGDRKLNLLSPVRGEVVAVNNSVASDPNLVSDDPYGDGWLMKVRVPKASATIKNLMSGQLAKDWMRDTAKGLGALIAVQQGGLQQDGGYPVSGFGRHLDDDQWQRIVEDLLLTDD